MKITEIESEEKHIDSIISFHKKERTKMRKKGRTNDATKHSLTIDLMYELKRKLSV